MEISNHCQNKNAIDKADSVQITKDGRNILKTSTAGWDMEVEWKDGTTLCLPINEIKATQIILN
jgi:hypothetical protein